VVVGPSYLTLEADNQPYTFNLTLACEINHIYTSYFMSTSQVTIQPTFDKRSLYPMYTLTVSPTAAVTGAVGSINIEWCETTDGATGSYTVPLEVLATNFTMGGSPFFMQEATIGSASASVNPEDPNTYTPNNIEKGWIIFVVIVGVLLMIGLCYTLYQNLRYKDPPHVETQSYRTGEGVPDQPNLQPIDFGNPAVTSEDTQNTTIHGGETELVSRTY
jgi:hypothetical protein